MSTVYNKTFLILILSSLIYISNAQTPTNDKNWNTDTTTMTFYDGFNGGTLSATKWKVGLGWNDSANYAFNISAIFIAGNSIRITPATNPYTGSNNTKLDVGDKFQLQNISGLNTTPPINGTTFTVASLSGNDVVFNVTSYNSGTYTNAPNGYEVSRDNYCHGLGTKNVGVSGGNCVLTTNYNSAWPMNLHRGTLSSKTPYSYGYYEIRCKLNSKGDRHNLAFWNFANEWEVCDATGPWYKEIDFFEAFRNSSTDTTWNLSSNVHSFASGQCTDNNCANNCMYSPNLITSADLYGQYHTYGYEWTPGRVIFYFDGIPYRTLISQYVSNIPLNLIAGMGLHDGRNWEFSAPASIGASPYINHMTIDYIKIHNLKLSGTNCASLINKAQSNFDPDTFDYKLYSKIDITGTSNFGTGKTATLRAVGSSSTGINISGTFNVPVGSSLLLLPTNCE